MQYVQFDEMNFKGFCLVLISSLKRISRGTVSLCCKTIHVWEWVIYLALNQSFETPGECIHLPVSLVLLLLSPEPF